VFAWCAAADEEQLVVHRGERAFVVLNKHPPRRATCSSRLYRHGVNFDDLDDAEILEVHRLGERPDGAPLRLQAGGVQSRLEHRAGRRRRHPTTAISTWFRVGMATRISCLYSATSR
jgi:hypothetical protein